MCVHDAHVYEDCTLVARGVWKYELVLTQEHVHCTASKQSFKHQNLVKLRVPKITCQEGLLSISINVF